MENNIHIECKILKGYWFIEAHIVEEYQIHFYAPFILKAETKELALEKFNTFIADNKYIDQTKRIKPLEFLDFIRV
jgi:hypothetical protein